MKDLINIEKIGRAITRRRNMRGLTNEALALQSKVSTVTLSKIEHGLSQSVTVRQLDHIAQALGMTCQELLAYGVEQVEGEQHG